MKNLKSVFLVLFLTLFVSTAPFRVQAQSRRASTQRTSASPTLTYDLGASAGSYNDSSYSEINLGLNWFFSKYLVWRNALFTRFGSNIDSASGLDTSGRLVYNFRANEDLSVGVFGGPGYRISSQENSGFFIEAGLMVRAMGLAVGLGVKSLTYDSPGHNANGTEKAKMDSTIFIILAGGGSF